MSYNVTYDSSSNTSLFTVVSGTQDEATTPSTYGQVFSEGFDGGCASYHTCYNKCSCNEGNGWFASPDRAKAYATSDPDLDENGTLVGLQTTRQYAIYTASTNVTGNANNSSTLVGLQSTRQFASNISLASTSEITAYNGKQTCYHAPKKQGNCYFVVSDLTYTSAAINYANGNGNKNTISVKIQRLNQDGSVAPAPAPSFVDDFGNEYYNDFKIALFGPLTTWDNVSTSNDPGTHCNDCLDNSMFGGAAQSHVFTSTLDSSYGSSYWYTDGISIDDNLGYARYLVNEGTTPVAEDDYLKNYVWPSAGHYYSNDYSNADDFALNSGILTVTFNQPANAATIPDSSQYSVALLENNTGCEVIYIEDEGYYQKPTKIVTIQPIAKRVANPAQNSGEVKFYAKCTGDSSVKLSSGFKYNIEGVAVLLLDTLSGLPCDGMEHQLTYEGQGGYLTGYYATATIKAAANDLRVCKNSSCSSTTTESLNGNFTSMVSKTFELDDKDVTVNAIPLNDEPSGNCYFEIKNFSANVNASETGLIMKFDLNAHDLLQDIKFKITNYGEVFWVDSSGISHEGDIVISTTCIAKKGVTYSGQQTSTALCNGVTIDGISGSFSALSPHDNFDDDTASVEIISGASDSCTIINPTNNNCPYGYFTTADDPIDDAFVYEYLTLSGGNVCHKATKCATGWQSTKPSLACGKEPEHRVKGSLSCWRGRDGYFTIKGATNGQQPGGDAAIYGAYAKEYGIACTAAEGGPEYIEFERGGCNANIKRSDGQNNTVWITWDEYTIYPMSRQRIYCNGEYMKMGYMLKTTQTTNTSGGAPTSGSGCSFYFYTPDGVEHGFVEDGGMEYAHVYRYGSDPYISSGCFYMPGNSPESGAGYKANLELREFGSYEELCTYDPAEHPNCSTKDIDFEYFVGTEGHSFSNCDRDFNCVTGCANGAHASTTMSGDCKQFGDKICCKN